uniref:Uncharacterized protein n=1 Tax=Anguilla anguilla TaxID=7936 RepID=A0A0E9RSE3_ANGAN
METMFPWGPDTVSRILYSSTLYRRIRNRSPAKRVFCTSSEGRKLKIV